jgi:hypothetical protein
MQNQTSGLRIILAARCGSVGRLIAWTAPAAVGAPAAAWLLQPAPHLHALPMPPKKAAKKAAAAKVAPKKTIGKKAAPKKTSAGGAGGVVAIEACKS